MNTMRRSILAATALLALSSGAAIAQAPENPPPGPPPGEHGRMGNPERELNTLTRVLTLTPEQQTGVKAVLEQQANQMKALRAKNEGASNDTPDAHQARMTQMEQIRDESNTKIAALLDENQKKTFADWTAKRKAAMERRRQEGGPAPSGNAPASPPSSNQ